RGVGPVMTSKSNMTDLLAWRPLRLRRMFDAGSDAGNAKAAFIGAASVSASGYAILGRRSEPAAVIEGEDRACLHHNVRNLTQGGSRGKASLAPLRDRAASPSPAPSPVPRACAAGRRPAPGIRAGGR